MLRVLCSASTRRAKNGKVIQRSRNEAGIRNYVATHLVKRLAIDRIGEDRPVRLMGDGKLSILFEDGSSYESNYSSYSVLLNSLEGWRNLYGAPLFIQGKDAGLLTAEAIRAERTLYNESRRMPSPPPPNVWEEIKKAAQTKDGEELLNFIRLCVEAHPRQIAQGIYEQVALKHPF